MIAEIEGVVMETFEREKDGKRVQFVRLFQHGERDLIDVPVDGEVYGEGEKVKMRVRCFAWSKSGSAFLGIRRVNE